MRNLKLYLLIICVLSLISCEEHKIPLIKIITPTEDLLIYKGDSVIIAVQANDPDGLLESVDFIVDNNNMSKSQIEPYKYVWHTDDAKSGQHTIKVKATDNEGLTNLASITVEIRTIRPKAITLPVSFVGTTYAEVGGRITDTGIPVITHSGFCWNKNGNPLVDDNKIYVIGDITGFLKGQLKSLDLGTKYYVKAFVQNVDTIIYGEEVSFTTFSSYYSSTGYFVDNRDSTEYKWVKIGNQIWMAENLKYLATDITAYIPNYYDASYDYNLPIGQHYTNSRPIKDIQTAKSSINYKIYGCLYSPSQDLCPQGWHIPTLVEWTELINFVGGEEVAGGILKESGEVYWKTPNTGGTNLAQFCVRPAGYLNIKYGDWFSGLNVIGAFYSSDFGSIVLRNYTKEISIVPKSPYFNGWEYYSIRCIKDKNTP